MNNYQIAAIIVGAVATAVVSILLYKSNEIDARANNNEITSKVKEDIKESAEDIKQALDINNLVLLHPLLPIDCGGQLYTYYGDSHVIEDIERNAKLVIENAVFLRSIGVNVSIDSSGFEIHNMYEPNMPDKIIAQKAPYLTALQEYVNVFFFPNIYLKLSTKVGAKPNIVIRVKRYKTTIRINTESKSVTFLFRALEMYPPEHNDKTIKSLYNCLDGELQIVLSPVYSFSDTPKVGTNYFCFTVGPDKEMYGYAEKLKGEVVNNGWREVVYRIQGKDIMTGGYCHLFGD